MREPDASNGDDGQRGAQDYASPARLGATVAVVALLVFGSSAAQAQSLLSPTVLTATAQSNSQITLVWNDPNPPSRLQESGYIVQQQDLGGSGWTKVFMSGPDTTSWTHSGLATNTTYSYRVKAFAFVGAQVIYSTFSPVASATTSLPPSPPTNLAASVLSGTQVGLTWRDNASNETGYQVSRSHASVGDWSVIGTTGSNQTSFTDSGAVPGTTYAYKVRAFNATGKSGPSNVVTATTTSSGGQSSWTQRYGGSGGDAGTAVTIDRFGNMIVAGVIKGGVDLGGGALPGTSTSAFIAKYTPSRAYQWARRFDGTGSSTAYAVATDSNGNVFVTGSFVGAVDFGGGPLVSAGWPQLTSHDVFVAAYSATGGYRWAVSVGGGVDASGYGIAAIWNGDVVVTGQIAGRVNLGCGMMSTTSSSHDAFLARYNGASGACQWVRFIGGAAEDAGTGVAVAPNGDIVMAGYFQYTANFGGGNVTSAGLSDIFVARYNDQGAYLWARTAGSSGDDRANSVAVDAWGNVAVAGYFSGAVNFGGGLLGSGGSWDGFVARYSETGGYLWARDLGGASTDEAFGVAADPSGNVVVVGGFQGTANFGGATLTSAGFWDAFVAKFGADSGTHLWSKSFGGALDDLANAVTVDGSGNAIVTGYFQSAVNFGAAGILSSAGQADIFVLAIGP